MNYRKLLRNLSAAFLINTTLPSLAIAGEVYGDEWQISAYAGRFTETRFHEIVRTRTRFRDAYVGAVALSRTWVRWSSWAEWDIEVQGARHGAAQNHTEINAALLLRVVRFPWDRHLSTTIALGIGPSFASSTPRLERQRRRRTSRQMLFMPFEVTAGAPDRRWEAFTRVHHRSGGFDVITRGSGSNLVAVGLRMRLN